MQNQLPKFIPLIGPHRLQYTNNRLAIACSMSIIVLRIINFTVVLCVHVTVLYLFYIKRWFTNLFHSTFKQRIAICMRMRTHGHQTMVTETRKTINFWGRFVYNMVIYWITILFIGITFFYWQVFLRRVKATNETTTLLTHFAYNTTLY